MEPDGKLQNAAFDQKTARPVVLGGWSCRFLGPCAVQQAGDLVFRGPVVTAGEVMTREGVAPILRFHLRKLVISQVAGTEQRASAPARPAPSREADAPRPRRWER